MAAEFVKPQTFSWMFYCTRRSGMRYYSFGSSGFFWEIIKINLMKSIVFERDKLILLGPENERNKL